MIKFPDKKYRIIYADPPWSFGSKQYQDSGRPMIPLENKYPVLSVEDIKSLPVRGICEDDAALFLWVTDAHLREGLDVINSWGFIYKTIAFVWVKYYKSGSLCVNFAPWTLKSSEICLLGLCGTMGKYKGANNIRQLVEAERTNHSKKPEEVRNRIDTLFPNGNRIELFARTKAEGWDVWGDEVEEAKGFDIIFGE